MFDFVFPQAYFFKTRLVSRFQRISWFFVFVVPVICFYLLFEEVDLIQLFFSFITINYIYENGYIQNDVLTVRYEEAPTKRLSEKEAMFALERIKLIFLSRAFVLFSLLCLLYSISNLNYFLIYIACCVVLQSVFLFYNAVRGKINIFLILPMSFLRFYSPLLPFFVGHGMWGETFFLVLLYPLCKTLEFTKEKKYNFNKISNLVPKVDVFRVYYYFFVVLIISFCGYYTDGSFPYSTMVSLYYFFYRLVGLSVYSFSARARKSIGASAKKEFRE